MIKQKPYLLLICPFALPNLGGVESHIDKLVKYASKTYYVVLLTYQPLTRKVKGVPHEYTDKYETHRVQWFGYNWFNIFEKYFLIQFLYLFPGIFIASLRYLVKYRTKIQVIHAHGLVGSLITYVAKLSGKILFKKDYHTVASTHAVYNFEEHSFLSWTVKKIFNNFDKVLAVSEVSKDEIIKIGVNKQKVGVHPNWVDPEVFHVIKKSQARQKLGIDYKINFLFVGRFIDKKGIELFLKAAENLKEYGFHAVGSGPLEKAVNLKAKELENLNYYGPLMQNEPDQFNKLILLYNACNYFVSPYLYDEGFSTTLIEALACGTKIVVTNRGSPPTFLSKDVAVFLSENPTEKELSLTLKSLAESYKDESEKCHDFASKKFGFNNADIIIRSYDRT